MSIVDGHISHLTTVNNTPKLAFCSSRAKQGARYWLGVATNYASSSCGKIVCRCVFESYHSILHSSQDSNPTPLVQPPSHARRWTQRQGNGNLCLLGINCICILCRLVSIITICSPWNRLRKWAEKRTCSPRGLEGNLQEKLLGGKIRMGDWCLIKWRIKWWRRHRHHCSHQWRTIATSTSYVPHGKR